jgi:hypothetical protein
VCGEKGRDVLRVWRAVFLLAGSLERDVAEGVVGALVEAEGERADGLGSLGIGKPAGGWPLGEFANGDLISLDASAGASNKLIFLAVLMAGGASSPAESLLARGGSLALLFALVAVMELLPRERTSGFWSPF